MNAKVILAAGLAAVAASAMALAQNDAAGPMEDRMTRMQSLMEEFDRAEGPDERYDLMAEHMALMRAEMADMQSMMMAERAEGETPDMTAMRRNMGMMQGMMMQMMGQQHMMMGMPGMMRMMGDDQAEDSPNDGAEDDEQQ